MPPPTTVCMIHKNLMHDYSKIKFMHSAAIYMNQNRKMVRATPNAASTMMTTITPPAMAPASLVLSLVTVLPGVGGLPDIGSASKKCIESIWIIRRA